MDSEHRFVALGDATCPPPTLSSATALCGAHARTLSLLDGRLIRGADEVLHTGVAAAAIGPSGHCVSATPQELLLLDLDTDYQDYELQDGGGCAALGATVTEVYALYVSCGERWCGPSPAPAACSCCCHLLLHLSLPLIAAFCAGTRRSRCCAGRWRPPPSRRARCPCRWR